MEKSRNSSHPQSSLTALSQKRKKPKDDGKTPEQRSAAAKKAAATRKANLAKGRGDLNGADYR